MILRYMVAALAAFTAVPAAAHCGGAFCTLNTNWDVQGVWDKPGIRLDLRAEFIGLDQLRTGTNKTVAAGVPDTHDEVRTINRNFVATLDYSIGPDWGFTLRAPLISRNHKHIHNDVGGPKTETWNFTEVGDMQAVARYTFYHGVDNGDAGVRFGLKLPTGSTGQASGAGEKAERSLQPGSGSTDAILGLYYYRRMHAWAWFAQGGWQQVIHERADFRPGSQLSADIGVNYALTPDWSLMLQFNALHKTHDSGANAEPADSGSTHVFLSPGVSYRATRDVSLYGFFQQPLYQRVRGVQLTADWSAAVGVSVQF
ncbi:MAG TPA: transporter [Novimethylophilus sp.]|uniref:transporter n=1 Tax=Novimethylophilus sp. TaxID=2137426 RepID=UPI002F3FA1DB